MNFVQYKSELYNEAYFFCTILNKGPTYTSVRCLTDSFTDNNTQFNHFTLVGFV